MAEENNQYTFENETYRKTYWHTCSHIPVSYTHLSRWTRLSSGNWAWQCAA